MIYVDELVDWRSAGLPKAIPGEWAHMMTDGPIEELHEFAAKIGLRRNWFHNSHRHPHYDLSCFFREKAIANGAKAVTLREMGRLMVQWQKEKTKTP